MLLFGEPKMGILWHHCHNSILGPLFLLRFNGSYYFIPHLFKMYKTEHSLCTKLNKVNKTENNFSYTSDGCRFMNELHKSAGFLKSIRFQ